MFNVSKKTLSVVLCLALLLSVVAVCFMTPATAKTVTSTQAVYNYESLSSKVLELTFDTDDAQGRYGLPFQRGGVVGINYNNKAGYVTTNNSSAWFFFGNESAKSVSTVTSQGATNAGTVVQNNLFLFEAGESYIVTIDYKFLAGSTVSNRTLNFGLSTNPNEKPAKNETSGEENPFTVINKYGNTVKWEVDGVAQSNATVLEKDTDTQTVSLVFTVKTAGYLGMQNSVSGKNVTLAIDAINIYHTSQEKDTQEKITFDNGTNGLSIVRFSGGSIATDVDGNRYGVMSANADGYSIYPATSEFNKSTPSVVNNNYQKKSGVEAANAAYAQTFKFKSNKTYEVTFKYRYPEGQNVTVGKTPLDIKLTADPMGASHTSDDLFLNGEIKSTSWAKDVKVEGLIAENAAGSGKWQTAKIVFTVKNNEDTASYAKIRPVDVNNETQTAWEGYVNYPETFNRTIEDNGVYFGIRVDKDQIVHFDDYEVKEITSETVSITSDYVYHDMDNEDVANIIMNVGNGATGAAEFIEEEGRGKVLKMTGASSRGTFKDTGVIEKGKKYYISFDAKSLNGTQKMWLSLSKVSGTIGSQANPRYTFNDDAALSAPIKCYINGEQTTITNFKKINTTWQHYGMVIDLTDAAVVSYIEGKASKDGTETIFDKVKYFYFGVTNSVFDNFTIVSTSDVEGAVPETEKADFSYVSKTYESTSASKIAVSATASLSEGVVSVTSGRFTFADSGIITAGHKYTFSFDAKLNSGEAYLTMIVSYLDSSGKAPRYFINNGTDGSLASSSTNKAVRSAFKFYIEDESGNKVQIHNLADYKVTDTWQKFIVEFDYTDAAFLAATEVEFKTSNPAYMGQLTKDVNYFYVGANNGQFKNFKIIEHTPGIDVEGSIRKPQVKDEKYLSAGLRFRAALPKDVADNAAEIGFVAAPSTHASVTADWYKLENGLNPIARQGVVKSTALDKNYIYATDGDTTYYQMVITGLSAQDGTNLEAKTAYNRRFSVVLYTKDAEGKYSYYALGESSYYQTLGNNSIFKVQ